MYIPKEKCLRKRILKFSFFKRVNVEFINADQIMKQMYHSCINSVFQVSQTKIVYLPKEDREAKS